MPVKYSDIKWDAQPVVWCIVYRNIELSSEPNVEKPMIHEADDEVQEICHEFKEEVARRIKKPVQNLHAESFAVQVVHSGIHFYIKASISNMECVHLRVHRPYSYKGEKPTLEAVKTNQGKQKPINYF